ncbi:hypothetical protein ACGFY9_35115 [Streptomyces sp. NPDC048504]|uniref:hypothetical protein n=1 Tax=Streptomyces sp. NPDC048504 TaxID=3365559 RepID=UPI003712E760
MRQSATTIDDYAPTASTRRTGTLATCGNQPGDPARGGGRHRRGHGRSAPSRFLLSRAA